MSSPVTQQHRNPKPKTQVSTTALTVQSRFTNWLNIDDKQAKSSDTKPVCLADIYSDFQIKDLSVFSTPTGQPTLITTDFLESLENLLIYLVIDTQPLLEVVSKAFVGTPLYLYKVYPAVLVPKGIFNLIGVNKSVKSVCRANEHKGTAFKIPIDNVVYSIKGNSIVAVISFTDTTRDFFKMHLTGADYIYGMDLSTVTVELCPVASLDQLKFQKLTISPTKSITAFIQASKELLKSDVVDVFQTCDTITVDSIDVISGLSTGAITSSKSELFNGITNLKKAKSNTHQSFSADKPSTYDINSETFDIDKFI